MLRVVWLPGSDQLLGRCHCGAEHVAEGPVEVWEWLLAHPTGHGGLDGGTDGDTEPTRAPEGNATQPSKPYVVWSSAPSSDKVAAGRGQEE